MRQRRNFIKLIQRWGVILVIGIAVIITVIDILASYRDFKLNSQKTRQDHIKQQKAIIKQEVERVVDFIRYEEEQSEILTRQKIKSRVYEAYSIARNIYLQNETIKNKIEIEQLILDALRPIRFASQSGYYFATRLDGTEILFADKPQLEGINLLNMRDTRGQYVVKDMIALTNKSGEGFYDYHWTKPNTSGNDFKKISFIKRFDPYDWFIGSGLYVDDVKEQIKKNLLATISRIRFGKEGYIFINRLNGDALVANGKLISDNKKLWEVFSKYPGKMKSLFEKEYRTALKPQGDFIYYSMAKLNTPNKESPKASFIYGIPELQWLVGAGVYLDSIETEVALMQTALKHQIKVKLLSFSLIVFIILIFFLLFLRKLNRRLRNDVNILNSFFNQAAFSDQPIDLNLVQFEEFDQMARSANTMLEDKIKAQKELWDEREALHRSEAKFRGLVESSYDWIFEIDHQAIFTYASPQVHEITGFTPNEVIGKVLFDFLPPKEIERMQAFFADLVENPRTVIALENLVLHKKGYNITLETSGVPFYDETNQVAGYRGVVRDITERKKAAAEKEQLAKQLNRAKRMESIGLMAGGVAHDLNNIISGIVGYPELILRTLPRDSPWKKQIEAIQESGKRAATVIADLLTIARGAASVKGVHNLNTLVQEQLNSPESKKLLSLHPEISYAKDIAAARPNIFCSPVHVKKCLMNLMANGAEAIVDVGVVEITTRNSHLNFSAGVHHDLPTGDYVILGVRDSGPGIKKENIEHIFEPFYTKKVMGKSGTGLGLTVVWNSMEDHGGKVTVESSDQGTLFQLYFPVSKKEPTGQPENESEAEYRGQGEHILVVDDESHMRDIARQMLNLMGYKTDVVSSGESALEFVKQSPVDLIVIDMLMEPGINGHQTYEAITQLYPQQKAIIASGFSESDDVKMTLKLGAGQFIKKPYSMKSLGRAVKEVLRSNATIIK